LEFEFTALARHLRVLLPPVWPVRVRRVLVSDGYGDCALVRESKHGPHFVLRVHKELDSSAQTLILIHEWAHALSWGTETHRVQAHGPEWGLAMSRIWQALLED
jgi:hypothetical protein